MTLGILGAYFLVMNLGYDPVEVVPLIAVLAYAFAYRMGLGLVPIVMTGKFWILEHSSYFLCGSSF